MTPLTDAVEAVLLLISGLILLGVATAATTLAVAATTWFVGYIVPKALSGIVADWRSGEMPLKQFVNQMNHPEVIALGSGETYERPKRGQEVAHRS